MPEEEIKAFKEKVKSKADILKALGAKDVIETIESLEKELEDALRQEAKYKNENIGYLASAGSDCAEVKRITAELFAQAPIVDNEGKKLTAAGREAWMTNQRTENKELSGAIKKQTEVSFELENLRITAEMAKKKLEARHKILSLKTAQTEFLIDKGG